MLPDLIRRGRIPSVGITASKATISLRITAEGPTPEACQAAMQPTADTIYQCLGDFVFGEDGDTLQDVVVRLLAQRGQTLSTVECGSGGALAEALSSADPELRVSRWLGASRSGCDRRGSRNCRPRGRIARTANGNRPAVVGCRLPSELPNRLRLGLGTVSFPW